jgi:type IX secretion system PorP/SprF family membrane protein
MKKIVLILIVLFGGVCLYGQSDAILTQQWFSRVNANPAATGNISDVNVYVLHRTQWSGFDDDAPQTSLLNATSYFDNINSGVGLSLSYDKEGQLQSNYNAKLAYAYQLKISENTLVSLGLGVNLQNRSVDWLKVKAVHGDDPKLPNVKKSKTGVDFDFGFEFIASRFTFGAALNRIGKSDVEKITTFQNGQQIYTYARYLITAFDGLDIAPSLTYVHSNHSNVWESAVTGFVSNKFWVGAAYRHEIAFAFLAGFEFNNMFRVGYAYDHYIKDSSNLGGTHEIMLSLKISK